MSHPIDMIGSFEVRPDGIHRRDDHETWLAWRSARIAADRERKAAESVRRSRTLRGRLATWRCRIDWLTWKAGHVMWDVREFAAKPVYWLADKIAGAR